MRKIGIFLVFSILVVSNCTYQAVIRHDQSDILITGSSNPGKPYKSKGMVSISKNGGSEFGIIGSSIFVRPDSVTAREWENTNSNCLFGNYLPRIGHSASDGWFSYDGNEDAEKLSAFFSNELVKVVKDKGGNAIINVSYSVIKTPLTFLLLPIKSVDYAVQGEIVYIEN